MTVYTTLFRDDALGQLRGDVVAALTYVTNWYQIWVGQGYTASGDFAPLRHLWSLAVEEQFYLVWPLVMVGLMRLGRRRLPDLSKYLFLAAIGVTVLMAVLYYDGPIGTPEVTPDAYWMIGERPIAKIDTLYLGTITRAGGLLLGAAFAMVWRPMAIMRGPIQHKGRLLDGLALAGLVGLGALCWFIYLIGPTGADPWLFRGGFFLCGLATLMMIAAVTHQRAMSGKLLGNVVLLWIGTRSYGLYLYHWPIYQGIRRVAGNTLTFPEFVVAIAATCVVTELSYRFIETPIRKGALGRWWKQLRASSDPIPRRVHRHRRRGRHRRRRVRRRQPGHGRAAPQRDRRGERGGPRGHRRPRGDRRRRRPDPQHRARNHPDDGDGSVDHRGARHHGGADHVGGGDDRRRDDLAGRHHRRPRHHAGARDDAATDHGGPRRHPAGRTDLRHR